MAILEDRFVLQDQQPLHVQSLRTADTKHTRNAKSHFQTDVKATYGQEEKHIANHLEGHHNKQSNLS